MIVATQSRGLVTYRCSKGCTDYQFEDKTAHLAEPTILPGMSQNIPAATGVSAQTAAMT